MEDNIAILFADLSGYTALTETHGAHTASEIIDKYTEIANTCLIEDACIHQFSGDEVLIVSSSADHLLKSAILLMEQCCAENNFLQLHGGLHFGKILKKNNNYFGTTINFASRIANQATPGTLWCSDDFINALTAPSAFIFESKGHHAFKNLNDNRELFELKIERHASFHIDPVCRMLINDPQKAIIHEPDSVFFCSDDCFRIYMANKEKSS